MPFSNDQILAFVAATFAFGAGAYSVVMLFRPGLSERWLRRGGAAGAVTPEQARAARLMTGSTAGMMFSIGLSMLARGLMPLVCAGQGALDALSFWPIFLMLAFAMVMMSASRRLQPATLDPAARRRRAWIVGGVPLLAIGVMIAGLFLTVRYTLGRPVEILEQIEMVSPTEGWAVGSSFQMEGLRIDNARYAGVIYHYQGGAWQRESLPQVRSVTGIAMAAPDEGWAVGDATLLHYRGGAWAAVPSPAGGLRGIAMVSREEGWAVGASGTILRYSGGRWRQVESPTDQPLRRVVMHSAADGWIIGEGSRGQPSAILRYQGGAWVPYANPTTIPLLDIQAISPTEAWAVGGSERPTPQSVILHFRDDRWSVVESPTLIPLSGVALTEAGEVWAVGGGYFRLPLGCADARRTENLSVILRYQGGRWALAVTHRDVTLYSVAITGPDSGWAVGRNTFWQYAGGRWREARAAP